MGSPSWASRLLTRRSAPALTILLALFIVVLTLMGRTFFGNPGFGIWTWAPASPATSQLLGDPYSFSHLLHGIIFFAILWLFRKRISAGWRLLIATVIEMGWEILENTPLIIDRYRAGTASLDYYGDSIWNSLGDVGFMLLGFWLTWKLGWKWSVLIVIAIELIMLFLMRDNLTLNVLMLVYPVQAIKDWQLAP